MELTFILPVRNRRSWVRRAIDSCLQNDRNGLPIHLLVIDGHSTDGTWEELQATYGKDPRVRLLRQESPPGFMSACFQAVPHVKTPWVTFMYDDDVLSPHWHHLANLVQRWDLTFALGLGFQHPLDQVMKFQSPRQWLRLDPAAVLRSYADAGKWWRPDWLPVSPICCITQSKILQEWARMVVTFVAENSLREEYLLRRAAGPDLMIFFLSLLRSRGPVAVLRCPVAQFSVHAETISGSSGEEELAVGYWLARVWLAAELLRAKDPEAPFWGGWVCHRGLLLLRDRWKQGQWTHSVALIREILHLRKLFHGRERVAWRRNFFGRFFPSSWRQLPKISAETLPLSS